MGETATIMTWFGIVSIVGLNGFASGVAAMLHLWRRGMRRGARIVLAATVSGSLPASIFIPMAFTQREFVGGEGPIVVAIGFTLFLVIAGVVSLPGAIAVTRKLERPSEEFRSFE